MALPKARNEFVHDELDLFILGELLKNPGATFKEIGASVRADQRTIAKRVKLMVEASVFRRSFEVDWAKLGVNVSAIVGSTTSVGEKSVAKFREYVKSDPRVVEAYETIGSHQYILRVLGGDLSELRDSVLREMEPLTADLSTSIVSSEVKRKDYFDFLRFLRETRYPRTRTPS